MTISIELCVGWHDPNGLTHSTQIKNINLTSSHLFWILFLPVSVFKYWRVLVPVYVLYRYGLVLLIRPYYYYYFFLTTDNLKPFRPILTMILAFWILPDTADAPALVGMPLQWLQGRRESVPWARNCGSLVGFPVGVVNTNGKVLSSCFGDNTIEPSRIIHHRFLEWWENSLAWGDHGWYNNLCYWLPSLVRRWRVTSTVVGWVRCPL